MINRLKDLWRDDSGISAIEYALMAAGIALAIVASINSMGDAINDKFEKIVEELEKETNT